MTYDRTMVLGKHCIESMAYLLTHLKMGPSGKQNNYNCVSCIYQNHTYPSLPQSSGAVWKSRWPSWAPVPNKPTVSVDVTQHWSAQWHDSTPLPGLHRPTCCTFSLKMSTVIPVPQKVHPETAQWFSSCRPNITCDENRGKGYEVIHSFCCWAHAWSITVCLQGRKGCWQLQAVQFG